MFAIIEILSFLSDKTIMFHFYFLSYYFSIAVSSLYLLEIKSCIGMKFIKTVFNRMGFKPGPKKNLIFISSRGGNRGFLGPL